MRHKRTACFLSILLVAFAMSAVASVSSFQCLEENFPSIGNIGSDCSNHWKTEYDALSRLTKSIRSTGAEEKTGYNALGYRTSFTNAEGKVISFGLDAQGRVTSITNAINKVTSFGYNLNGNLVQRTDAGGQTTDYSLKE